MRKLVYAGIGSRATPRAVLETMRPVIASQALPLGRRARMAPVSAASRSICACSFVCESSAPATALALWAM